MTTLAVAALVFFIAVFAGAVVWVMSRRRGGHYAHMASLPLEGDDGSQDHSNLDRRGRGGQQR
ncbi:MAG: cbb3-type cytochrome c oxidase subunit 3 [Planctomycetota bacterium]